MSDGNMRGIREEAELQLRRPREEKRESLFVFRTGIYRRLVSNFAANEELITHNCVLISLCVLRRSSPLVIPSWTIALCTSQPFPFTPFHLHHSSFVISLFLIYAVRR